MKSTPSPPQVFVRISERDLTEIELHSVDSINDLHRTHSEQHSKGISSCHVHHADFKILIDFYSTQSHFSLAGVQPPRPPPPTSNGNLQMQDQGVVYQTGQPVRRPCVSRLNDICTSTRRHYFLACAAIIAFLLSLILIFSFLGETICLLKLKLWN